ncbi:MAG: hypothetical protein WBP26_05700 [Candidatus Saccharimonadales bacterium]
MKINTPLPSRRLVILAVVTILVIGCLWYAFIYKTFVRINVVDGTNSYSISSRYSGKQVAKGDNALVHIRRGSYIVRSYQDNNIVGVTLQSTTLLPFGTIQTSKTDNENYKPEPILGQFADSTTPLANGEYLYIDKRSKAVMLANEQGVQDISNSFNLSSGTLDVFNRVTAILPTKDKRAVVVTTKELYLVKNSDEKQRLNPYATNFEPNYYSASYDTITNSVFLLNAYDSTVYKFSLDHPTSGIAKLYTSTKKIQAVSAGGGKVVLYANNIPSTSANVIKKFGEKTLVGAIILDATSGKQIDTLPDDLYTMVLPSQKGNAIAIKTKFSTTLDIYNIVSKQRTTIPAYDISGLVWIDDVLYIGRDDAVWAYDNTSDNKLRKIADTGSGVTSLTTSDKSLIVSTLGNIAQKINLDKPTETDPVTDNLSKLEFYGKYHYISFVNVNGVVTINKLISPNYEGTNENLQVLIQAIRSALPNKYYSITEKQTPFPGIYRYATVNLSLE